jgi:hypothetical protein
MGSWKRKKMKKVEQMDYEIQWVLTLLEQMQKMKVKQMDFDFFGQTDLGKQMGMHRVFDRLHSREHLLRA